MLIAPPGIRVPPRCAVRLDPPLGIPKTQVLSPVVQSVQKSGNKSRKRSRRNFFKLLGVPKVQLKTLYVASVLRGLFRNIGQVVSTI